MSGALENSVELWPMTLVTIFLGLGVIIFALFFKWIKQEKPNVGSKKHDKPEKLKPSTAESSSKHSKKEQASSVKSSSKKKLADRENRRTARATDKAYPTWSIGSLKGHTGRVLDMDAAPNGKFLASCGEGLNGCTALVPPDNSCNSTDSNRENSLPSSQNQSPLIQKGLSRRQRKNRKHQQGVNKENVLETSSNQKATRKAQTKVNIPILGTITPENLACCNLKDSDIMTEQQFAKLLGNYTLKSGDMTKLGYPLRPTKRPTITYCLDVHAVEFVPRGDSGDSGNGSEGSEASGNTSEEESSSTCSSSCAEVSAYQQPKPQTIHVKDIHRRICVRCGSFFFTTTKKYITRDCCTYHWGKLSTLNHHGYGPMVYMCCKGTQDSVGCAVADLHVWNGPTEVVVTSSFAETVSAPTHKSKQRVFSLDCEMSYTVAGLEAVKITVVDMSGLPIYDEYVQPLNEIVDFNTRYSGITKETFLANKPKPLCQVQREILTFISSENVLVGHGLENDFKALRLLHKTVVDTSFIFPHYKGLPFRRSLKSLMRTCLKRDIQCGDNGHDSFEDARACMELMLNRIKTDFNL